MKKLLFTILLFNILFTYSQETKPVAEPSEKPIEVINSETSDEVSFAIIEKVPVYKGCDKTKSSQEIRKCMSNKIRKHVAQNFNIDIASANGIVGRQRIVTSFKINKEGHIIEARARASHPALEQEAIRVVNLIPQMESPGFQRGKPVIVAYSLPMIFQVEAGSTKLTKKEKRRKRKEEKLKKAKSKN